MKWLSLLPALLLASMINAQKPGSKPTPYAQIDVLALRLPDSSSGEVDKIAADMIRHLRIDVENYQRQKEADRQNRIIDSFNLASRSYNGSVNQFNVYINFYNQHFKPEKPDAEIRRMLDSADHQLQMTKAMVAAIVLTPADSRVEQPLGQLKEGIAALDPHIREMQEWLVKYFSKGKMGRKSMFYKITWFGIPVN